jgi:hypothetical protein
MRKKIYMRPRIRPHMVRLFWTINLLLFALAIWWGLLCFNNLR